MPKKYVKKYKPRYRRRRRRYRYPIVRRVGGFPQHRIAKLRYCHTASYDAGAGTYSVNKFRANCCYDPDATGVGGQPSNFDTFMGIYSRFCVLGSKITVEQVHTTSTALTPPPQLFVTLSHGASKIADVHAAGGVNNLIEQPDIRRSIQYIGSSGNNVYPLRLKYSARKFHGLKDVRDNGNLTGTSSASPTEQAYFEVAAVSPDDSVNPAAVILRVIIDYIVLFKEPLKTDNS